MSEAMKPTPGEWQLWTSCSWRRIMTTDGTPIAVPAIARDGHPDLNISEDDARLIVEAGTVFHETQLSPRQLVERVKELEEALTSAQQAINSMKVEAETAAQGDEQMMLEACETISNDGLQADMEIRAALSKTLPNTVAEVKP